MSGLLDGHLALVTGSGSGIGRAIARGYANAGAAVITADINADDAAETAAMIESDGGTARSYAIDVSDYDACQALAQQVESDTGRISVLVNNAGIVRRAKMSEATARDDWYDVLAVNLDGVFNITKAFLDHLKANKGRVINIGSIQSFVHTPNCVGYTAAKGGVRGFTTALAAELGAEGVRVNAIGPGLIRTPLNENTIKPGVEVYENFMRHTPMGRPGTPDDIVGPAVFLASDLSAYVTGVTLPVDGGYLTV